MTLNSECWESEWMGVLRCEAGLLEFSQIFTSDFLSIFYRYMKRFFCLLILNQIILCENLIRAVCVCVCMCCLCLIKIRMEFWKVMNWKKVVIVVFEKKNFRIILKVLLPEFRYLDQGVVWSHNMKKKLLISFNLLIFGINLTQILKIYYN